CHAWPLSVVCFRLRPAENQSTRGPGAFAGSSDDDDVTLHFTSYFGAAAAHQHVYFAAHAKFRKVNPGFDGKTAVRQNQPLVVDLEIIHVGAVGMDFGPDGMPGAVHELSTESSLGDVVAHRIIHLPAGDFLAGGD